MMRSLSSVLKLLLIIMIGAPNVLFASAGDDPGSGDTVKVMLAELKISPGIKNLSYPEVEAAFNFACTLSGKFKMISGAKVDSILKMYINEKQKPTIAEMASRLGAGRIGALSINRIGNMLRVYLRFVDTQDSNEVMGTGYAQLRYRDKKTGEIIYIVPLLSAIQRAVAGALRDTTLYAGVKKEYIVYPAPTLVVGSINYQNDESLPRWEIFEDKSVSSFDAVETIFKEALLFPHYITYDIESRDSIYALSGLYLAENFNTPGSNEINSLYKAAVDYYITGTLKRMNNGAEVELTLCRIGKNKLQPVKTEKDYLHNDSTTDLREILKHLTAKLLEK